MAAKNICPILLAAGQSRRFGGDKLLHVMSHNGERKALILHTLSPWLEVFADITVVIRDDNTALRQVLTQSQHSARLKLVLAPDAEKGMSASLISAIKTNSQAEAWLIGLADMPFIDSSVIQGSVTALLAGAVITQPDFDGQRGHPVGFASRFLPQLLALTGDKGARQIVSSYASEITPVVSPDDGILRDIDTREMLHHIVD